ncbi:MAG: extracellular solute-binding protein, partial [Sulfolobales archaeon]
FIVIISIIYYFFFQSGQSSFTQSTTTITNTGSTSGGIIQLYVADAYTAEAQDFANNFAKSTGIQVAIKSAGSLTLARQIAQGSPVSVFMPVAIDAVRPSFLGNRSPGWAIAIGADQLVLAYSNLTLQNQNAKVALSYANKSDWYNFFLKITDGSLKIGIADPTQDPAGFRGWLVLQLAGYVYANGDLKYFVDRIIANKGNISAAHAADLVAPLVAGNIQFLFIYRSAAIAKGLYYVQLPPQINLGDPNYTTIYQKASLNISGTIIRGAPIYLYITIPKDPVNPDAAVQFLIFVIKNNNILSKYGITPLKPAYLYNSTQVPKYLLDLISQNYLIIKGSL